MRSVVVLVLLLKASTLLAQTWVPTDLKPEYQIKDMLVHDDFLYIAGHFNYFNDKEVHLICRWNGDSIEALGKGLSGGFNPFVRRIIPWGDSLIVVGNFDYADTMVSNDVAIWYKDHWIGINNRINNKSGIHDAAIYKGQLYVCGDFDSINNIKASNVARWDGTRWWPVGEGVFGYSVNDMQLYGEDLYVTGAIDSVSTEPARGTARWDGQAWQGLGNEESIGGSGLGIWENKLLISEKFEWPSSGEIYSSIYTWDGSIFKRMFKREGFMKMTSFYSFFNKLFAVEGSGHNLDSNYSLVSVWDETNKAFVAYGRGINRDPTCMAEYKGEIYVGGLFHSSKGAVADFIARLVLPPESVRDVEPRENISRIYPNPGTGMVYLQLEPEETIEQISIRNIEGRLIQSLEHGFKTETGLYEIDLSAQQNGIYFISVKTREKQATEKLILMR